MCFTQCCLYRCISQFGPSSGGYLFFTSWFLCDIHLDFFSCHLSWSFYSFNKSYSRVCCIKHLAFKTFAQKNFLSEYWISDKSYKFSVFLCSFCEPVPKNNQQEKQKDFSLLRYQLNVHVFINVYRQVLFFWPIATFLIFMKFYFCSRLEQPETWSTMYMCVIILSVSHWSLCFTELSTNECYKHFPSIFPSSV